MAVLALGVVGASIGAYVSTTATFLGMSYAAIGWTVGTTLGGLLFAPKGPDAQGPRVSDLRVQTSAYGVPIPQIYGTMRVSGNIIWSTPIREVSESEEIGGKGGGGGGTQTTYTYFVSMAIALCEGPIIGVRKIWMDGVLYYSVADEANAAELYASNQRVPYAIVYPGSETQLPDPTMEADKGVGNVPGYRRTAYIVFTDLPLVEPYFGRRPNITCEVVVGGSVNGIKEVTTNQAITGTRLAVVQDVDGLSTVQRNDGSRVLLDLAGSVVGEEAAIAFDGAVCASLPILNYSGEQGVATRIAYGIGPFCLLAFDAKDNRGMRYDLPAASGVNGQHWVPDTTCGAIMTADDIYIFYNVDANASGATAFTICRHRRRDGLFLRAWGQPSEEARTNRIAWDPVNSRLHLWDSHDDLHRVFAADLTVLAEIPWILADATSPNVAVNGNDVVIIENGSPGSAKWYKLDGSFAHTLQASASITLPTGSVTPRFVSPQLVATGYGVIRLSDGIVVIAPTVGSVVWAFCEQSGLQASEIDVSALTDTVHGMARSRPMSARAAIEILQKAYWFDAVESGGKIKFVKRGAAPSATIDENDLGAVVFGGERPSLLSRRRAQELELPQRVTVNFVEPLADYDQGSAHAQRIVTDSVLQAIEELPVALTAQRGAEIADVLLNDAWAGRMSLDFSVSRKHAAIEPCDVVQIVTDTGTVRARITRRSESAPGLLRMEAIAEEAASYVPKAIATAATTSQAVALKGPTSLDIVEAPLLRDEDDGIAAYSLLDGYLSGWSGAALSRSADNGSTWATVATVTSNAMTGIADTVLGTWSGGNIVDEANVLQVTLRQGDELSSVTFAALMASRSVNAAALINSSGLVEIIQYRSAELISGTTYRLSGLLRGRGGTEDAMGSHAAGDVFVSLSGAGIIPLGSAADLALSRLYEAITAGSRLGQGTRKTHTHGCRPLKPLSVALLAAAPDGAGGLSIKWTRCGRLTTQWRDYADIPLGEASEQYAIDIYDGAFATKKRTLTSTGPSATYTGTMRSADGLATASSIGVDVYQISASVGRGVRSRITAALAPLYTVLLHCDGVNGSQVITDEAGHAVSVFGNAQISTAQSKFGGASVLFDGAGDYLNLPQQADLDFDTGDFTVDLWFRVAAKPAAGQYPALCSYRNNAFGDGSWSLRLDGDTGLIAFGTSANAVGWTRSYTTNTWVHVAVVRAAGVIKLYADGVGSAGVTDTTALSGGVSGQGLNIGRNTAGGAPWDLAGYIDELRIIKGAAAFTADFTPPAAPY